VKDGGGCGKGASLGGQAAFLKLDVSESIPGRGKDGRIAWFASPDCPSLSCKARLRMKLNLGPHISCVIALAVFYLFSFRPAPEDGVR
jgi:hypothetical protein